MQITNSQLSYIHGKSLYNFRISSDNPHSISITECKDISTHDLKLSSHKYHIISINFTCLSQPICIIIKTRYLPKHNNTFSLYNILYKQLIRIYNKSSQRILYQPQPFTKHSQIFNHNIRSKYETRHIKINKPFSLGLLYIYTTFKRVVQPMHAIGFKFNFYRYR